MALESVVGFFSLYGVTNVFSCCYFGSPNGLFINLFCIFLYNFKCLFDSIKTALQNTDLMEKLNLHLFILRNIAI